MCISIILLRQGNAILQSLRENVKVSKQIDNVLIVIGKNILNKISLFNWKRGSLFC